MKKLTKEAGVQLITESVAEYKRQLEALPIKKPLREALIDGFKDGMRSAVNALIRLEYVEVESPEPEAAKGEPS